MKILITGGAGFVGHHFVEAVLKATDWDVIVTDCLTYASGYGFDRLRDIKVYNRERVKCLTWDLRNPVEPGVFNEIKDADYIVHMAAESHVDRSIADPVPFIMSNVLGTQHILLAARRMEHLKKFINFSSDEVFGPAEKGVYHTEHHPFRTTNPYAATKAAAVLVGEAEYHTHKTPVLTTFTMNVFGERQNREKFLIKCIRATQTGENITIHSTPDRKHSGSRCWIHARNASAAVLFLLEKGVVGERYNIVGEERNNSDMANFIMKTAHCKYPFLDFVDFHSSRPGHDLRYALDGSKMEEMGWRYPRSLEDSLAKMVQWTLKPENIRWIQ
jgi:dTDP-glucose 4,6-dehydratase